MIRALLLAAAVLAPGLAQARPPELVRVVRFGDDFRLVGIGVSQDGRIFATAPSTQHRSRYSVVEVDPRTGTMRPYPDAEWNRFRPDPGESPEWVDVQALWVDPADHLWALDSSLKDVDQRILPPKLVEFDLATNRPIRTYTFGDAITPADSLNDVRIDLLHHAAYITDAANKGGLLVVDLDTGAARLELAGSRSAVARTGQHLRLDGTVARWPDGQVVSIQTDGIALSPDDQWVYYRPLTDHAYWRIPTAALLDRALGPAARASRAQFLGDHVIGGGMIMDRNGTLLTGDLEHHAIMAWHVAPDGAGLVGGVYLRAPKQLAWADGFAISGGQLYVSDSHLNEVAFRNDLPRSGDFTIFRVPLPPREGG